MRPVEGVLIVITVILVLFDQLNIQQFVVFYLMYERWAEKCLTNLTAASKLPVHAFVKLPPTRGQEGLKCEAFRQFLSGVISAKIMFQIVLCRISNFSYWQSNSFLKTLGR